MQLYLFTHWFHFIEIGKKIRACGHDFEDVVSAYLVFYAALHHIYEPTRMRRD